MTFILFILFGFNAQSQCLFIPDTTITLTPHTLNLNTVDLIGSGCCDDTLWLVGSDTAWFTITFLITSNKMVIDYNHIGAGYLHCSGMHQLGGWYVAVNCDTIQPDLTPAPMPYNINNANILGLKQFSFVDSLIGQMAIAMRFYRVDTDSRDSCHIRPCAALYQTGNLVLGIEVTQVPIRDPYPNPCNESIRFDLPEKRLVLEVISMQGQRLIILEKDQGATVLNVGTLDLPTGVYLFRLIDMNNNATIKKVTVIH